MSSFPLLKVKVDADDYYDCEEKGDENCDDFDRTLQSKVSQNRIFGLRIKMRTQAPLSPPTNQRKKVV